MLSHDHSTSSPTGFLPCISIRLLKIPLFFFAILPFLNPASSTPKTLEGRGREKKRKMPQGAVKKLGSGSGAKAGRYVILCALRVRCTFFSVWTFFFLFFGGKEMIFWDFECWDLMKVWWFLISPFGSFRVFEFSSFRVLKLISQFCSFASFIPIISIPPPFSNRSYNSIPPPKRHKFHRIKFPLPFSSLSPFLLLPPPRYLIINHNASTSPSTKNTTIFQTLR